MKNSFNEQLTGLLKSDPHFVDEEGELIKGAVIDRAWKIDHDFIKLLLSDTKIKAKFFEEIEGHWVFNTNSFIDYISDKNFLANSYTSFRNKIGLNIDGKFLKERGEVSLVWPYKDCVLEGGQTKEEEKRKEIFFNEILAQDEIDRLFDPKVLINWKHHTVDGEEKVINLKRDEEGTIKENLIIKGNNLLALHTLKRQFQGKVKLIYIDPPYNTGNDSFGYNDNFNHSAWLTFMKNRLEIAKELLREDGVIIVQCDDNESVYTKILMDEIFQIDNFITTLFMQVRYGNKTLSEDNDFQKVIEQGFIYSKNRAYFKPNKDIVEYSMNKFEWKITELEHGELTKIDGKKTEIFKKGQYKIEKINPSFHGLKETWASGSLARQKGSSGEFLALNIAPRKEKDGLSCLYKIYGIGEDGLGYRYFTGPKKIDAIRGKFYSGIPLQTLKKLKAGNSTKEVPIINFKNFSADFGNCRHEGGVNIKGGKKPEVLLEFIISKFTNSENIILDYHLGSGTTCAVAHKMKRQYIGIEQLDYGSNDSIVRLKNVIQGDQSGISKALNWQGGGDFVYCELMKYNEVFMDKIQMAEDSEELLDVWQDIAANSFLNWYVNPETPEKAIGDFKEIGKEENGLEKQKKLLCELLNINQLYINMSEIYDRRFKVSQEDKELNHKFYGESYYG